MYSATCIGGSLQPPTSQPLEDASQFHKDDHFCLEKYPNPTRSHHHPNLPQLQFLSFPPHAALQSLLIYDLNAFPFIQSCILDKIKNKTVLINKQEWLHFLDFSFVSDWWKHIIQATSCLDKDWCIHLLYIPLGRIEYKAGNDTDLPKKKNNPFLCSSYSKHCDVHV